MKVLKILFCIFVLSSLFSCVYMEDNDDIGHWTPPIYEDCTDDSHYDNVKNCNTFTNYIVYGGYERGHNYDGYVFYGDTLATCTAVVGNHETKEYLVKDFPINAFSCLIPDTARQYEMVANTEERINIPFTYKLLEEVDYENGKPVFSGFHYKSCGSDSIYETEVNVAGHRIMFKFKEGYFGLETPSEGINVELQQAIDLTENDTIKLEARSSYDPKLLIIGRSFSGMCY